MYALIVDLNFRYREKSPWQGRQGIKNICGVLYAAVDALGASFTRQIAGPRDYTLIYSRVAIVVNLAGAGAATLFAAVAEISWEAEWIMSLALLAITFVLGFYTITKGKQLKQTFE